MLRNDNLDPQRARPEFARALCEDLRWLGLDWNEGPDVGGLYAPYAQSERYAHYLAAWGWLVAAGAAYPCSCSRRELRESVNAPHEGPPHHHMEEDDGPMYSGRCRPIQAASTIAVPASPAGVNWRFRVPDGEAVCFRDQNCGEHRYVAGRDFGDFLIWRRDDVPAYQLACVVDDAAMQITEVVRGADLLKTTARQLLLYQALGLAAPDWYHCPLVAGANGRRLAKRADAVSIRALREAGHTPAEVLAMARAATLG